MLVSADIDTDDLPDQTRDEILSLVEGVRLFELPARVGESAGGADRFEYTLSVQDGARHHMVTVGETNAPASLMPLLRLLTRLARAARQ